MTEKTDLSEGKERMPIPEKDIWAINLSGRKKLEKFLEANLDLNASKVSVVDKGNFSKLLQDKFRKVHKTARNKRGLGESTETYEFTRFLIASGIENRAKDYLDGGSDSVVLPLEIDYYDGILVFNQEGYYTEPSEAKRIIGSFSKFTKAGQDLQKVIEKKVGAGESVLPQHEVSLILIFI